MLDGMAEFAAEMQAKARARPRRASTRRAVAMGNMTSAGLSRDVTDLLLIARDMQRAGAGLRSIAEPVVDTTSAFAELVLAMLGIAAKLERRTHSRTHRARPGGREGEGRQIRPQAETHCASAARGAAEDRGRRDTAQRRAELLRKSGHHFTPLDLRRPRQR
jgi:DNA invertase Pin-like site-specific DNA recombinase